LYPWTFCIYGRFVERTFCREGRYVEGRFVDGRFVEGRLVEGRFVLVPVAHMRTSVLSKEYSPLRLGSASGHPKNYLK
jgi:hypothetical protein